jgi:hypothetical protein
VTVELKVTRARTGFITIYSVFACDFRLPLQNISEGWEVHSTKEIVNCMLSRLLFKVADKG